MDHSFWLRQAEEPLFPEVQWLRPQQRAKAGKLLIVGGSTAGFHDVALAHQAAGNAGAGRVESLLPDRLRPRLKGLPSEGLTFLRSTPSGSLASDNLGELVAFAQAADGVYWPGDLGRNSDTTVLLERYLQTSDQLTVMGGDTIVQLAAIAPGSWDRAGVVLLANLGQLQHLIAPLQYPEALLSSYAGLEIATWLSGLTAGHPVAVLLQRESEVFVGYAGRVSSTAIDPAENGIMLATRAAVYAMQLRDKLFEALTTAVFDAAHGSEQRQ